jgi:cyclic beta-1,2-glucan synthetase
VAVGPDQLFINPHADALLRGELHGLDHLEAHARQLAAACSVAPPSGPVRSLLRRFAENGRVITRAYRRITERAQIQEPLGADAEWLLDNFHIIEETLREVKQDLPSGYYKELPSLCNGPLAGYPRVYAVALALIAHTDSGPDETQIIRFVHAFQTVAPLTIGELWAVPTMLRLSLIENLRRLAQQMLQAWEERRHAHDWVARHAEASEPVFAAPPRDSDTFYVHLLEALRNHESLVSAGIEWLEAHLARCGTCAADVVRRESQRQAANQVTVGNCVTSLRLLSALDWNDFFEHVSLVEALLRTDPAGAYTGQDFATRDRYRREIEKLSRGSTFNELDVARRTLALARSGDALPRNHVGYYLIGPGREALEAALYFHPTLKQRLLRLILGHPNTTYFGSITVLLALLLFGGVSLIGPTATGLMALTALALLVPASEVAVALVNYLVTWVLPPRVLPKLDFREGIPSDCATFVVMPSMLVRPESAAHLLQRLEIHYLANPDPHLRFALLTDFADAPDEHRPEDEGYVEAAVAGVKALNQRYAAHGPDKFFLFHRRRQWNPVQNCWMGWERKRGKLSEFNRLLRGARDTSYHVIAGDATQLPRIRFVITLDVDTRLPREMAQRLVGTLAHPLNQPRFVTPEGRVVEGYGILQPRISFHLGAAAQSLFARIFTGSAGLDPYTTAVSDVYQDLFGTGSYIGKGIYDVDAFEAAVGARFADNSILSHDLIEGNFARCGLVTDIELLDDFPARYHAYARREHRWVRGDWQLLPWLFGKQPKNPLPLLERWKVIDNLRRSLVPPALLLLFVLGWTMLPGSPWLWNGVALAIVALPVLLQLFGLVLGVLCSRNPLGVVQEFPAQFLPTAGQAILSLNFLAEQARLMLDAIVRTLIRLFISQRDLLEWETAFSAERRLGAGLSHFLQSMGPGLFVTFLLGVLVVFAGQPGALVAAAPFLILWLLAPLVAYLVSRALLIETEAPLTYLERYELQRLARKTWGFFETFVGAEDHWLPPDNFQEDPKGDVAHRTSPTNMGLLLLSSLAAHDMGYVSLRALLRRLERTFDTFSRLERYRGHFHNWYDTRTLKSLVPIYISTVDSGNLLGCLIALKQGLRAKIEEPLPLPQWRSGLEDTLGLTGEALQALTSRSTIAAVDVLRNLEEDVRDVRQLLRDTPADLVAWLAWLKHLEERTTAMRERVRVLGVELREVPEDLERWVRRLHEQTREMRTELDDIAPWLGVLAADRTNVSGPPELCLRWEKLRHKLLQPVSLADLLEPQESLLKELAALEEVWPTGEHKPPCEELTAALRSSDAEALRDRCRQLADQANRLAHEMDFAVVYNSQRHLFAVGYNLATGRLDTAHYDLLASEARLASFLAIARGDAPRRHWFQLGRPVTSIVGKRVLISWGGTMFEYLMPRLLLRTPPGTLLDASERGAVDRQIQYGRQRHVPWGISESAFNALDTALDYQYQSFGVPGLGLKRGLAQDLVIAPYATMMAVMMQPRAALENLRRIRHEGGEGPYGCYEAIDYTPSRLPRNSPCAVVRNYMAHHQGMALVALVNCLNNHPMQRRFHAEPMVRASDVLLEERVPRSAPIVEPHGDESALPMQRRDIVYPMSRRLTTPDTPHPRTHLLSHGRYHVMLTNAGGGYSGCDGLAVTRWREDRTRDCWGQFLYLRDLRSGEVWSATYQPLARTADEYEVTYSADKADFRQIMDGIETHLEITVTPENCAEVRRLTITNHNERAHEIEVTSYAELVLAPASADMAHPAFGKLFIETEFEPTANAILARRRPRSAEQKPIWGVHVVAVDNHAVGGVQHETDRARFLGRGRTPAHPAALDKGSVLSGTTGAVLDPVFSLRRWVKVDPGMSACIAFTTAVAETREEALALADKYHDLHGAARAFELGWAHSQVELRHYRLSSEEAHLYQRLAAFVIYAGSTLRAPANVLTANQQGQPGLWRYGVSGDKPIMLVRVQENAQLGLVRQLLAAHTYWRLKGLEVDLIILNEHATGYFEELQQRLQELVRSSDAHAWIDRPGGVFVRKSAQVSPEDQVLLQAAARIVLSGDQGSLISQIERTERERNLPGRLRTSQRRRDEVARRNGSPDKHADAALPADLRFTNGLGGFTPDGREYVIVQRADGGLTVPALRTPAPWINVIANPTFGCLVSEAGGGYTWFGNSQTNRLTPWTNDPVADPPGEVVYLRDEASGEVWTPTPLPVPASALVRHGQGYSVFEQTSHGLHQELLIMVPLEAPVKLLRLKLRNLGNRPRKLAAAFFAEWVLGTVRDQAAMHVITEVDAENGALLARNPFNLDFGGSVAFADVNVRPRTFTADRTEFLGRNGRLDAPAALERQELSNRCGPALDPCAALLAKLTLAPGEETEVVFLLGQAATLDAVRRLVNDYRVPGRAERVWKEVRDYWDGILTAVQVKTPDAALDLLVNRWLLYQTLSCRVWGRSAFYQSGGAYGFRDQLQDVMALVYGFPSETRAQLLRAAARQFREGDVQHWWHPPAGRGIRTRFSDDLLWLPLVTSHYVTSTGDVGVLDEQVPFLQAPLLKPEQEEDFGLPEVSEESGTLYEHCVLAIEHSLKFGAHGLPLMGTGDWNDGMNKVGAGGKGESVWDAWFLLAILDRFVPLAAQRGDADRAGRYRAEAERLRAAAESAWDGHWYRRAYFDDGTLLGSAENDECKIDSIVQTWAVISGRADPQRAREAMAAMDEMLVRRPEKLILLFTPPFDHGKLEPGYIKGYLPGIRENGGQYTHAATWVVQAAALLGQGDRAVELFGLLNPIGHAATPEDTARYKVEPYVMAADLYSVPPHAGRGGWTWYTGSSGWLYRVALETMLGFQLRGEQLEINPCVARAWKEFEIVYRHRSATYRIRVANPLGVERGVQQVTLDGQPVVGAALALADDGREHEVRVLLG